MYLSVTFVLLIAGTSLVQVNGKFPARIVPELISHGNKYLI